MEECMQIITSHDPLYKCSKGNVWSSDLASDVLLGRITLIKDDEIERGEFLGKGSFGDVYAGTWKGDTRVAVKEMSGMASVRRFVEFQKEVFVMSTVENEHIVRILGVQVGPLRVVMEMCSGGTLSLALVR